MSEQARITGKGLVTATLTPDFPARVRTRPVRAVLATCSSGSQMVNRSAESGRQDPPQWLRLILHNR